MYVVVVASLLHLQCSACTRVDNTHRHTFAQTHTHLHIRHTHRRRRGLGKCYWRSVKVVAANKWSGAEGRGIENKKELWNLIFDVLWNMRMQFNCCCSFSNCGIIKTRRRRALRQRSRCRLSLAMHWTHAHIHARTHARTQTKRRTQTLIYLSFHFLCTLLWWWGGQRERESDDDGGGKNLLLILYFFCLSVC